MDDIISLKVFTAGLFYIHIHSAAENQLTVDFGLFPSLK